MFRLLKYHVRSVLTRWRSSLATLLGIALVVAVFIMVQALAVGLEKSASNTGDPSNLLVTRQGALAESTSLITRDQYQIIRNLAGIEPDNDGQPLASADLIIVVNLPRLGEQGAANVLIRGLSPKGAGLRGQAVLVSGRWFQAGQRELVVSTRLASRFAHFGVGESVRVAGQELLVVGHFDAARSAFDSEAWMDAEQAKDLFDREDYSSVLLRPRNAEAALALQSALENDRRLKVKCQPETLYYAQQTQAAGPIRFLGHFLAIVMSVGAVFAAMNTLYASVGSRTREIGTLRVLGFRRRMILGGFVLEGAFLSGCGGLLGCLFALPLHGYSTGTIAYESFAEMVFDFQITPTLAGSGFVFAVLLGVVGSIPPALRASRMPVISALKSS